MNPRTLRNVLLAVAALFFCGAVGCFLVAAAGVVQLLAGGQGAAQGVRQVASLQPWGLGFMGCMVFGFIVLMAVPKESSEQETRATEKEI